MHFYLEWVLYAFSKTFTNCWTKVSRFSLLLITDVSRLCMPWTSEVMKSFSSLLSFLIDHILTSVFISPMPISMISGMWLDGLQISGWSICQPNPVLPRGRKMRYITELVSHGLSANLVGPEFDGGESLRPKLSAIVMRSSVWEEWCLKLGPSRCLLCWSPLLGLLCYLYLPCFARELGEQFDCYLSICWSYSLCPNHCGRPGRWCCGGWWY